MYHLLRQRIKRYLLQGRLVASARQNKQAVGELGKAVDLLDIAFKQLARIFGWQRGVAQRDLNLGLHTRKWRAQLVRSISRETVLRFKRVLYWLKCAAGKRIAYKTTSNEHTKVHKHQAANNTP